MILTSFYSVQLSVRIKSYVDRSRVLVRESMLVPEFLEVKSHLAIVRHKSAFIDVTLVCAGTAGQV